MIDVEMHFDFASPYSYFADCRIEEALRGLDVRIKRVPVYLRGYDAFRNGVPFESGKLVYFGKDLARHGERYGIPFALPPHFPVNGLHALRGLVHLEGGPHADAFRRAAFRAAWADSRDIGDVATVVAIAGDVGADREAFAAAIKSDAVKEKVKANTAASIARGAFGAPSFFVGDEMFWGQDRLDFVRWAIERRG